MGEVYLNIKGFTALRVRLEPTDVRGSSVAGLPVLSLPLKLQLLPAAAPQERPGQAKTDMHYVLLRLAGSLSSQPLPGGEFASFEAEPLAEASSPSTYDHHLEVKVPLDRERVRRFEDKRAGADANLSLSFRALVWLFTPPMPGQSPFEATYAGPLQIVVPKSHWAEQVVQPWGLESVKLIEIRFPKSETGENFRAAYSHVKAAERQFADGQYKQVLTTLRLSFEALAISLGFEKRVKECFESLFADSHPEKKEKAREALTGLYKFLHLGPHEQAEQPDISGQPVVLRRDARFALTMAYVVFEYITPQD